MRSSIFCGPFIDSICFSYVLLLMWLIRGWEFDEIKQKSSSTEKPNYYKILLGGKMKKLFMIISLSLILCFMVSCQDKEAMAELEGCKAQAAVKEQNKEIIKRWLIKKTSIL